MYIWLAIGVLGGIIALIGLGMIYYRYRRGKASFSELMIIFAGFVLFVSLGFVGEMVGNDIPAALFIVLLPLWFGAITLVRRRRA